MATAIAFKYRAVDGDGREEKGTVQASDREHAVQSLRQRGLFPVDVTGAEARRQGSSGSHPAGSLSADPMGRFGPRLRGRRLTVFTRQLATLLKAGVPLVRALRLLEEQAAEASVRRVVSALANAVEGGGTFSDALAAQPFTFDRLYVSMVRAGEVSGQLDTVLKRQADLLEKRRKLIRKIRGAMAYPAVVFVVALGITTGLMVFIVPKFAAMFEEMLEGSSLPALTQWVIGASNLLLQRLHVVIISVVLSAVAWRLLRATRLGAYWSDRAALRLPGFGILLKLSSCAHFCNTLGTLSNSGVPILQALAIVRDAARNRVLGQALGDIQEGVKEGDPMSMSMRRSGVFPAMLVGMVKVGEETGALPDMLERVAESYEEEVDAAVEALTSMLEPALIVVLAVIIGTIVIGLFLPLLSLASNMAG